MFPRLACIMLLAVSAVAGDFLTQWPDGKTEKLTYEVTTFIPAEMKASTSVEITKSGGAQPFFTITQFFNIPMQRIQITSREKYRGNDFRFESADNLLIFPPEAKAQLGTDTVRLNAIVKNDTVEITSNLPRFAPSGKIPYTDNLTTSVGSIMASRDFDFRLGSIKNYNEVDFLSFNGMPFQASEDIDSVMGEQEVTIPAGTFPCFKLISQDPQAISYTYFTKDSRHIPVLLEIFRASDTVQVVKMILQKYE